MADGALGRLVVSLEANIARFEQDLTRAEGIARASMAGIERTTQAAAAATKTLGLAIVGLGAGFSASVLIDKFDAVVAGLANLKDMSEKTGASVENLSGIAAVARISGQSMDVVEVSITKLAKSLAGANDEAKGAGHALDTLGLSAKDLRSLDTAEAFKLIADRLSQYRDGAGKTALVMDIFGKSGAQLLPLLKDLAESGDLVARTTQLQAYQADEYEKSLRQLTLTKDALYKVIAIQVLPVVSDFVKVLLEAKDQTGGVQKAVKDLAADGSIKSWAESGAMAVAHLLDEMQLIKSIAIEVATPIERVGRNIYNLGALASIAVSGSLEEKRQAYAALKAESEAFYAGLDARLKANREPVTLFADRLRASFGASQAAAAASVAQDAGKPTLNGYVSKIPALKVDAGDKSSAYDNYLAELDRMIGKLNEGEYAAMRLKAAQLATKEGVSDVGALGKIAAYQSAVEASKIGQFGDGLKRVNEQFDFQSTLIGKSAREQEVLTAARRNYEAAEESIRAAEKSHVPFSLDAQAKIRAAALDATDAIVLSIEKRRAAEADWQTGAIVGLKNYADEVGNVAKSTEALVTRAFKGMEDALVQFARTGKLDFKSLADSIISDLIRIQVQQSITRPLAAAMSSGDGLVGGLETLVKGLAFPGYKDVAGVAAGVPSFAVGTDYVPRDMLANIHRGERIVPASQNTPDSRQAISITVNVPAGSPAETRRAAGQGAREALAALNGARRYG